MRVLSCLLVVLCVAPTTRADDPAPIEPDRDAVVVSGEARLAEGTFYVAQRDGKGVLRIVEDDTTLDMAGALLHGATEATPANELHGVGILVENARNVTIRNGRVAGFKVGIRAANAPGLVIEDVDASGNFKQRLGSTPEREDPSDWLWPHENDQGEWEAKYGAGISLSDCEGATVRRCRVNGGQNGVLLTRCRTCAVYDNDLSFNSGWGIGLYRTTHSEISHNSCDFCVRGYSHGVYHRGQDSAAVLLFEQCSHNLIARNSATHSGDGLFLYAGHETTKRTGKGGSNFNRVLDNDFSYAVANAIEATFSEGNVFVRNDCSGSDHGVWAGYSRKTRIQDCRIRDCLTAGVSIEHGHENTIASNDVQGARYGVHLWWDDDKELLAGPFGREQDCFSHRNLITKNVLAAREAAVRLVKDDGCLIAANRFPQDTARIELGPEGLPAGILQNEVAGKLLVVNRSGSEVVLPGMPSLQEGLVTEGKPVRFEPRSDLPALPLLPPAEASSVLRGSRDTTLPADMPRGREAMRIDEWGPVDPRTTRLFPSRIDAASPMARLHLYGDAPFEVEEVSEGVVVKPSKGKAPATLEVKQRPGGSAHRPFRVRVRAGGEVHTAEGTLLLILWDVRFFRWTEAEDPTTYPKAFARLLAGTPVVHLQAPALDWAWGEEGPAGVARDHFATLAQAEPELPAGAWRLRVVSDDGVRVYVGGKPVIARWNRHASIEDQAVIQHGGGPLPLQVEHFEIDGWAHLSFRLDPVPPAPRREAGEPPPAAPDPSEPEREPGTTTEER